MRIKAAPAVPSPSPVGYSGEEEREYFLSGQNGAEASCHPHPAGLGLRDAFLRRLFRCVRLVAAMCR